MEVIHLKNFNLTIKTAEVSDAKMLRDFVKFVANDSQYLLRSSDEEFTLTIEQEADWIKKAAEHENSIILIGLVGDEVIAVTDAHGGKRKRIAHIAHLGTSVAKKLRGQGVGQAMMMALCNWARANKNLEYLELSVMGDNIPARSLYKKLGFVEVANKPNSFKYKDGSYQDEIVMRLKVES